MVMMFVNVDLRVAFGSIYISDLLALLITMLLSSTVVVVVAA